MKKSATNAKRTDANDSLETNGVMQGSAELVSEAEVPTTRPRTEHRKGLPRYARVEGWHCKSSGWHSGWQGSP
jgi:hypothetical protein